MIHGTDASLETDVYGNNVWIGQGGDDWEELTIPQAFIADDGPGERRLKAWNRFFARFVRDVEGSTAGDYPTFHGGWIACQIMDAVRSESCLKQIQYE